MPRHPPYALKNLNTQYDQNKSQRQTTRTLKGRNPITLSSLIRDARVHCAVLKKQPGQPEPHHQQVMRLQVPQSEVTGQSPFPQDPTACPAPHPPDTAVPTPEGHPPGGTC